MNRGDLFMKKLILLLAVMPVKSMAFDIYANTQSPVVPKFGMVCLGLDGVPIAENTPAYSACCDNGVAKNFDATNPAPDICKGLQTTKTDAQTGGGGNLNLANQVLAAVSNMDGSDTNGTGGTKTPPKVNPNNPHAQTSGYTAGGASGDGAGAFNPLTGAGGKSNLGGAFGGGGGGGGGGNLGGNLGSTSGDKAAGNPEASGPNSAGVYTHVDKPGGGASGDISVNPGDTSEMKFSGDGSGNGDGSGYANGNGNGNGAGGAGNGDVVGSSIDPADYFNLTKPGDDIFVLVHKKYQQKSPKMAAAEAPKK